DANEPLLPLTPVQRAILLHSLRASDTYFDQIRFRIDGPLDVRALRQSWATLLARHAALRCAFVFDDADQPAQRIERSATLPWHCHDWRSMTASEAERMTTALMLADRQAGFALDRAPLMRMHLIRRGDTHYEWL